MIEWDNGEVRFNYRVAGACLHDGHVLLHRGELWPNWALPGGRVWPRETAQEALRREMREEIASEVAVGRLLWVVENFFTFDERRFHELGFIFTMTLPEESPYRDVAQEFTGHEGAIPLRFRWFPADALEDVDLRPAFLREALREPPATTVHVVQIDEGA